MTKRSDHLKIALCMFVLFLLASMTGCGDKAEHQEDSCIDAGALRKEVFALVSSAENSSIDYSKQYAYIEDIGDGRGYTAGVIGFTSGTSDLLAVVNLYAELKADNILEKYIPALEAVNGTDSHEGLGDAFLNDWEKAADDLEMIQAQNTVLDEQYMSPAVQFATKDGLSPLGQYIYYDALVVHGNGDDEDSFGEIRDTALTHVKPPADGGDEAAYLNEFLKARTVVMEKEEAHSDLSRLEAQEAWIDAGNFSLELPLEWTVYGEKFTLTQDDISKMK